MRLLSPPMSTLMVALTSTSTRTVLRPRRSSLISCLSSVRAEELPEPRRFVLTVGEGDFGYSAGLCRQDPSIRILATSLDAEEDMPQLYPESAAHIAAIRAQGSTVGDLSPLGRRGSRPSLSCISLHPLRTTARPAYDARYPITSHRIPSCNTHALVCLPVSLRSGCD